MKHVYMTGTFSNVRFLLEDGTDVTNKIRLVAMNADGNHVYRFLDEGREEDVQIEPGEPPKGRG